MSPILFNIVADMLLILLFFEIALDIIWEGKRWWSNQRNHFSSCGWWIVCLTIYEWYTLFYV